MPAGGYSWSRTHAGPAVEVKPRGASTIAWAPAPCRARPVDMRLVKVAQHPDEQDRTGTLPSSNAAGGEVGMLLSVLLRGIRELGLS